MYKAQAIDAVAYHGVDPDVKRRAEASPPGARITDPTLLIARFYARAFERALAAVPVDADLTPAHIATLEAIVQRVCDDTLHEQRHNPFADILDITLDTEKRIAIVRALLASTAA